MMKCNQKVFTLHNDIIDKYSFQMVLQWIPSHCSLPRIEAANFLATKGAIQDQPYISLNQYTLKLIINENSEKQWLNNRAQCNIGSFLLNRYRFGKV